MNRPPARTLTGMSPDCDAWEPLVEELVPAPLPEDVFRALSSRPRCLFLDSARFDPQLGRYSFLTADPFDYLEASPETANALMPLADRLARFRSATVAGLPPFQGGAAGLYSYDLGRQFERVPLPAADEFRVPALAVGLYDVVVAFDHVDQRAWIVSQGWPETTTERRRDRAARRLAEFRALVASRTNGRPAGQTSRSRRPLGPEKLVPQHPVGDLPGLTSNFTREAYLRVVERAVQYIHAGDIFQVNLSQRLLYPATTDTADLYLRLRQRNAATFAAYFDLGEFQIASASPERFLQVRAGCVEARPIKGTRRRSHWPEADLYAGDELLASEKDRAENVMIVDLLRNDLSRVCLPESIGVTELCRLETYEYVQHLVSVVQGRLRDGTPPWALLPAAFPGGSITGAPKVRAMEIIAELEPTARGPYCGSLGYLGFDGAMDTSILIRTVTAGRGWWQAPVGGGIVAQSTPAREYEETWVKAEGLLRAF